MDELVAKLEKWDRLSSSKIKTFINACFYQRAFHLLERIPEYLTKAPKATWYCIDFLVQERAALPSSFKHDVAGNFAAQLAKSTEIRPFQALAILQLFAYPDYLRPQEVLLYYTDLGDKSCPYTRRLALDAIYASRSDCQIDTLFEGLPVGDPWCARALLRLALGDNAAKIFVKSVGWELNRDPFADAMLRQA